MQIRLSWQMLAAVLIFLVALFIVGRSITRLVTGPGQASGAVATAAPAHDALPSAVPLSPTGSPAVSPSASPTALPASPTALPASPTALPTPAPSPTSPEPTATVAAPPTATPALPPSPVPTAAPAAVRVVAQGFAQAEANVTYAFTIQNPNPDLIARDTRYQIVAYDGSGIVLRTDSGLIAIIGAGQQTGVVGELTLSAGRQVARIEVVLGRGLFVQAVPLPPISAENVAIVPGEIPVVTGILRSPYQQDLEDLAVVAILYDAGGSIIGGGSATVPFLPGLGQAAAEVPVHYAGEPAGIELYPQISTLLSP
ncbi:MAG: hypothetical protein HGA45_02160 [Chloroflexales bacterium]|nr:hypothetical protein [Chloroflexales bacterium]